MASWDEIKRLAADFQRTQASESLQRISDRNCIDIIKKLKELNLIELIYTCDGNEFVTPECLLNEIKDEITVNCGRLQINELASRLNVNYEHIESKCKELVKLYPEEYSLILGQIIHSSYQETLKRLIKDGITRTGQLSVADLSKTIDLPPDFLSNKVSKIIKESCDDVVLGPDEKTFYTSNFLDNYKALIVGTLTAVDQPTSLTSILKRLSVPEKIFHKILDESIKSGRLDATIENRQFIPNQYVRRQNDHIDGFYSQNFHVDYEVVSRLDIKNPKVYLKKRFPNSIFLKNTCVHPNLFCQVESMIEEVVNNNSWIDVSILLPSSFEEEDIDQVIQLAFAKNKKLETFCCIFNRVLVCSNTFVESCKKYFDDMMKERAQEHLKEGKLVQYFLGDHKGFIPKNKDKSTSILSGDTTQEHTKLITNLDRTASKSIKQDSNQDQEPKVSESIESQHNTTMNENMSRFEDIESNFSTKKERRKSKKNIANDNSASEEEVNAKKGKSRKSGSGTQGREVKTKAVKKKYLVGKKGNQKNDDDSVDEQETALNKRRSKGGNRSRRTISSCSDEFKHSELLITKPNLVFLNKEDMVKELRLKMKHTEDNIPEEFLESVVSKIEPTITSNYISIARSVLDEYLRQQADKKHDSELAKEDEAEILS